MDRNAQGNPTRQRWKVVGPKGEAVVDFLTPAVEVGDEASELRNLEGDFAAIVTPGLELAFRDRQMVEVSGETIMEERCTRRIGVCGPGAFIVLKALAFGVRGLNKDAFDLFYVVRNYGSGVSDVAARLRPLLDAEPAQRALQILERDFSTADAPGPMRVAAFVSADGDVGLREDVVGFVTELVAGC